ncbi:MAG: 2-succinyl-5-enolpyruvyl-6-hydroxy-3-cyclohexene-1-carboxylic-acid synthase [Bacteroidetes bacterium]|nr:2-succinyl-5-enolpyruvyl-6-hydroxy-3-cyclohexene-1-carboxylic-acid synthase [Bacteroidota bacterium]
MPHEKTGLLHLADLMISRGIHDLIISPGSRNAPIISTFCNRPGMRCLSIVDERSAAFFALGMAQQSGRPVAIACTSGSAVLNYAPAIAEAYYQRVPLVVLTADRPVEWIDQGDGQTIRQKDVFANFIRKSVALPQTINSEEDLWFNDRLVAEALNSAMFPVPGPVHINLPFSEPLYDFPLTSAEVPKDISVLHQPVLLPGESLGELARLWNSSTRKIILVGQLPPCDVLQRQLISLSKDPSVVVLSETTSNVFHEQFIGCIDRCLSAMTKGTQTDFAPDMLLTFGTAVVSKRIKTFLRKSPVRVHWHVDPADLHMDTYQHLSHGIAMSPVNFFAQLMPHLTKCESDFAVKWQQLSLLAHKNHQQILAKAPWSDLQIMHSIFSHMPDNYAIQLANSTPVRYAQLFDFKAVHRFDSNRGTSGIDGSISTASGAAFASQRPTLLITGDLAFFYDVNGLWNKHLPANLRIIMVNNQGGGIFRFIDGPDSTGLLEDFFEARHQTSAKYLAMAYGLNYQEANDLQELNSLLPEFLTGTPTKAAILEINSPPEESASTLRNYFASLRQ